MDRRTLLAALGSAAALTALPAPLRAAEGAAVALLYWMPYDNDMGALRAPILKMLAAGARGGNVLVAVQSDTPGAPSMQRVLIDGTGTRSLPVDARDSSSAENLAQFLEWGARSLKAEAWAVVILGHGGTLDTVSPDDTEKGFMQIEGVAAAMERFNAALGGSADLLFFQNCNKGTIETFYAMRKAAHVTLGSQALIGAPNYYYEGFLRSLQRPAPTSLDLARRIVDNERADMLATLVATDNHMLDELPRRLQPLLEAVRGSGITTLNKSDLVTYVYPDESEVHVDLIVLLAGLSSRSDSVRLRYLEFAGWLWNVIGVQRLDGRLAVPSLSAPGLSGIGILLPRGAEQYERYRALPFYATTRFWDYVPYKVAAA